MININIKDKIATVEGSPVIVCGNSDYVIQFTFDDEWADKSAKTARFVYLVNGQRQYQDVVFTGDTVNVPVLANTDEVAVGAFAGDLATTTPALIRCVRSIRCGTGAPADPTPSQYDQIMATIATKEEWITIADTTLTEEVASLEFTTDINGNPFKCKKIVFRVLLSGGHGVSAQNWYFGRNAECKTITLNTWGMVLIMETNEFFARYYGESYAGWLQDNMYRACVRLEDAGVIEKFVVQAPPENPMKSGDVIKVWGLKA